MERGAGPRALCRRSAEVSGDDLSGVMGQAGSGQVQHDAPHRRMHPGTEFHQVFARDADLSGSEGFVTIPFTISQIGGTTALREEKMV